MRVEIRDAERSIIAGADIHIFGFTDHGPVVRSPFSLNGG